MYFWFPDPAFNPVVGFWPGICMCEIAPNVMPLGEYLNAGHSQRWFKEPSEEYWREIQSSLPIADRMDLDGLG
jgi:hypothetical protein